MKSNIEKDLLKIFEAGKKCMSEHPDDDSYDSIHFNRIVEDLSPELSALIKESRKPQHVKDAEKYIMQCHSDFGFMGSQKYYESKNIVDGWYNQNKSE